MADPARLTGAERADLLRGLCQAESQHLAARAAAGAAMAWARRLQAHPTQVQEGPPLFNARIHVRNPSDLPVVVTELEVTWRAYLRVACRTPGCGSVWYKPRHDQDAAVSPGSSGSSPLAE